MNQAQLASLIATAVAAALASQKNTVKTTTHKAKSTYKPADKYQPKGKIASDGKTERQLKNEVLVAKAFKKIGLDVTPREDVFTYNQWLSKGKRVNKGEKGLFVKGVGTLFHSGQVSVDIQPSKAEMVQETAQMLSFPA